MEIPKSFLGYKRENGRAGTRNHVIILPVDDISNACAEAVSNNIKGTIALPHSYRLEPIKVCCKNNINLLIEKPLVLNTQELKIINKYISKKNLIHSISFVHRYRKEVLNAKKLLIIKKLAK